MGKKDGVNDKMKQFAASFKRTATGDQLEPKILVELVDGNPHRAYSTAPGTVIVQNIIDGDDEEDGIEEVVLNIIVMDADRLEEYIKEGKTN